MATATQQPEFLTVRELADYLRVSLRTAYHLIATNEVPSVRVGGQYRIPRGALDASLTRSTEEAGPP